MTSIVAILNERGQRYGDFRTNADLAQRLKHAMHSSPAWLIMQPVKKEAIDMILSKIARIGCGDEDVDGWKDVAGYAELVLRDMQQRTDSQESRSVGGEDAAAGSR